MKRRTDEPAMSIRPFPEERDMLQWIAEKNGFSTITQSIYYAIRREYKHGHYRDVIEQKDNQDDKKGT
jgi:hypothetical protein